MSLPHRSNRVGAGSVALAFGWALALGCAAHGPSTGQAEVSQRQAVAHYKLGVHHLSEGNTALAIRELRAALEKNPRDPWIHLTLAEGYRRKAKAEDAERHLLEAMAIDPRLHQARLNLSALYIQMGRHLEAAREARLLVDDPTFPAPWHAHTNLGKALTELGRTAEARSHLRLALDYRPYYWRAALNLAMLEAGVGHKLEGIELFQRVLGMHPGPLVESEVNYRLGELYVSVGRREEALSHLSQAVALLPNGHWGKRSEEYLKLLQ